MKRGILFFVTMLGAVVVGPMVFAYGDGGGGMSDQAILYIAGLFSMAIAAVGGTNAQSKAACMALEGMARNPAASDKLFMPLLISLALMESLVIFTLASIFLVK